MKFGLFIICNVLNVILLTSVAWGAGDSIRQFAVEDWRLELVKSSQTIPGKYGRLVLGQPATTVEIERQKDTYSLVLKGDQDASDRIIWTKDYIWHTSNGKPQPGWLEVDVYDVARAGDRIVVLYAHAREVNLDVVSIEMEEENHLIRTTTMFERNSGFGPPTPAGRLLMTSGSINMLFDLGEGALELWQVKDGRAERLWSQRESKSL